MKPETTTDYDPVPEGLEFDERYMDAAFALYDVEKKERKRRILIWIWSSSAGMAAVLLLVVLFSREGTPNHTIASSKTTEKPTSSGAKQHEKQPIMRSVETSGTTEQTASGKPNVPQTAMFSRSTSKNHFSPSRIASGIDQQSSVFNSADQLSKPQPLPAQRSRKSRSGMMRSADMAFPLSDSLSDLISALPLNDSSDSAKNSLPHLPDLKEQRNHRLYINTGINTLFGMSQLQSGFHLRETVGLNYDYHFAKRFTLSTQLELYALPGISHQQYLGTDDSESASISLTKISLHYLTLAPRLDFRLGEKHHLALGAGIEYLIINPGEKYEIRDYTGDKNSGNKTAFYESFNRFNYFVSLGYGFDLSKRFSIYGTYHVGLSDMTKNSFNTLSHDRNSRLQLMLRMRIF